MGRVIEPTKAPERVSRRSVNSVTLCAYAVPRSTTAVLLADPTAPIGDCDIRPIDGVDVGGRCSEHGAVDVMFRIRGGRCYVQNTAAWVQPEYGWLNGGIGGVLS